MTNILCPDCKTTNDSKNSSCKKCMGELTLKNRYFLLKILDNKSVITYLAYDKNYRQKIIIKEFSLVKAEKWDSHDLFKKEGDILAQLNHPSIPRFIEDFETGIGDNSKSYIAMEYINGISLKEEQRKNRYTEEEVIEDILEITKILDYLHNLIPPIIHQDLNLSNIMRRENGSLALIDFNAVQDIVEKEDYDNISGTYGFIAPEQLSGKAVIASDYYALGVVILVLLTRKQPEEMLDDNNNLNWKESLQASNKIIELLEGLLLKEPKERIQTLEEVETILLNKKRAKKQKSTFENQKPETKNKNSKLLAKLRVVSGMKIQDFKIKNSPATIGRAEIKDGVQINHNSLSRKHCMITQVSGTEFKIIDLGSTNGVRVNGKKINPSKTFPLYFGDKIKIGDINLKFVDKNDSSIKNNKKIIDKNETYSDRFTYNFPKKQKNIAIAIIMIAFSAFMFYLLYDSPPRSHFRQERIYTTTNNDSPKKVIKKVEKKLSPQELYLFGKEYQDKKDYKKANTKFLKACDNGNIKACELLGWNYEKGLGFDMNLETAMKYYKIACKNDSGYSCNKRGFIIDTKLGKNYINKLYTARAYFKKSCDLKFGLGCKNLGDFYLKGKGVKRSRRMAKKFYRKACKFGYKKACKL